MGTESMNKRVIACLSGGVASAWCANWTLENYPKEDVILYFNDTKWEHPDLYRFIRELSTYWNHKVTEDNDGRTPEDVFKDQHMLANNRAPFCSRVLKAQRLQKYFQDGDTLVFGIGTDEMIRAHRLVAMYQNVSVKRDISCKLEFPLIKFKVSKSEQLAWLRSTGINIPELYLHGFKHNNCAGGCVRAGKGQWAKLLREFPEVYRERERVEREFRIKSNKDVSFLKDGLTLEKLRRRIEAQPEFEFADVASSDFLEGDCIGTCDSEF